MDNVAQTAAGIKRTRKLQIEVREDSLRRLKAAAGARNLPAGRFLSDLLDRYLPAVDVHEESI